MAKISVDVPDDLLEKLTAGTGEVGDELRLAAAYSMCSRGQLSVSQAARLAGLAYADFLQAAARAKVELFPIDLADLREEIRGGYTLGRQCVASHPAGPRGAA